MADLPFTLDQLRILRAIVSEGSFKKAADSLFVTQPAVSLQIQNLEKQLEVSLFDRGGRKAQLTEAGHLLLGYCDRILSQCHEACRALDDLHNLKGGSLVVGASQTTGTYLMPRMIGLSLYRLDINFRESAVVGIVGGGGIGATLLTAFDRYEFESAAAILLIIIGIVMMVEYSSSWIRGMVK